MTARRAVRRPLRPAPCWPAPRTFRSVAAPVAEGVLVVQPEAGTFKAYDAACPHQGVRVGAPRDGVITCPAHNSTFSPGDGARLGGPATKGLTEIPVRVDGTTIVRA
ncbi:Rieske (2Fe-2S) protein [Micromonospora zamorensis]|uniref:Rieske (2Fe-2S) protein n=1 Tax=Micromonospora zamorensis TaxID=709883 RepID=UPI0033EA7A58